MRELKMSMKKVKINENEEIKEFDDENSDDNSESENVRDEQLRLLKNIALKVDNLERKVNRIRRAGGAARRYGLRKVL